jgi:hypothetical protein
MKKMVLRRRIRWQKLLVYAVVAGMVVSAIVLPVVIVANG